MEVALSGISAPGATRRRCRVFHCSASIRGQLTLLPVVIGNALSAQEIVRGRVLSDDGSPVAFAEISTNPLRSVAVTTPDGRFAISVGGCPCRLLARRLGFAPDSVTLSDSRQDAAFRLRRQARALSGVAVEAPFATAMAQTVTATSARAAPAIAESDLFRAIILLPGVSQPIDRNGRVHLAGGASDETAIRLDGHPLQDPFHMLGLFGSIHTAAIDRAEVQVAHLPVDARDHLSGAVDIQTRHASSGVEREAGLGLLSSSFTYVGETSVLHSDLLASVRVAYLDKVLGALRRMSLYKSERFPFYGFHDITLRGGRSFESGRAELLFFSTGDQVTESRFYGLDGYRPFGWGEKLLGGRIEIRRLGWNALVRGSISSAYSRFDERAASLPNWFDNRYDRVSAAISAMRYLRRTELRVGAGIEQWSNRQNWEFGALVRPVLSRKVPQYFSDRQALAVPFTFIAISGDGRAGSLEASVRASRTDSAVSLSPGVRWTSAVSRRVAFSASLERRFQYAGDLAEPASESLRPPQLVLSMPERADVAGLSLSMKRGSDVRVDVQGFAKRYESLMRLVDRPTGISDAEYASGFPRFERLNGDAFGGFAGFQAGGRRGLVQGGYTYQRIELRYPGGNAPPDWDVPHSASFFAVFKLDKRWSASLASHARSGLPSTPVDGRVLVPADGATSPQLGSRYTYGRRNSVRTEPYRRIDASLRRSWLVRRTEWAFSLNVFNIVNRANATDVNYSFLFLCGSSVQSCPGARQRGTPSLPMIPTITVEARW